MAALVSITVQLLIEGFRWQMAPLYLVVLALGLGDLGSMERELPFWRRVSRPALGLVGVAMMTLPPAALPVPQLAPAVGGSARRHCALSPSSFRIDWRPTALRPKPCPGGWRSRFGTRPRRMGKSPDLGIPISTWSVPSCLGRLGFPGFFVDHTVYTQGSARLRATPLPGRFPVIIYSHDYADFRTVAVNQLEALASRGYFVVAPDHSYASLAARLPDGTEFELDPAALPSALDQEATIETGRDLEEVMKDDLVGIIDQLALGELGAFGNAGNSRRRRASWRLWSRGWEAALPPGFA